MRDFSETFPVNINEYGDFEVIVTCANTDRSEIDIQLFRMGDELKDSVFDIKLLPSWKLDTESNAGLSEGDIKKREDFQKNFSKGDYFQHTFKKNDEKISCSLGNKIHKVLFENRKQLSFIKNIYSTTLKDGFSDIENKIYYPAIHFWIMQLFDESDDVTYVKKLRKFKLHLND